MSTLLKRKAPGPGARCAANCYDSKAKECRCVCGGLCHGLGRQQAIEALYQLLQTRPDAFDDCEIATLELTPEFQWDFPTSANPPRGQATAHA